MSSQQTALRHLSFWLAIGVYFFGLAALGLSKFGDTRVLEIAGCLAAFEALVAVTARLERQELHQSRARRLSWLLALAAGLFTPANLILYHYGIHPLAHVSGVIWLYASLLAALVAVGGGLARAAVPLLKGRLYPSTAAAMMLGSIIDYAVWISGA